MDYVLAGVYQCVGVATRDTNIFITIDLLKLLDYCFIHSIDYIFTKNLKFTVKMVLYRKKNRLQSIKELARYLYLVGRVPYFEFELYSGEGFTNRDQFLMEGIFAGYGSRNGNEDPGLMFISEDPANIKLSASTLKEKFNKATPLLRVNEELFNLPMQVRMSLHNNVSPILFMPFLPVYFGGEDLRKELIAEGKIDESALHAWQSFFDIIHKSSKQGVHLVMLQSVLRECYQNRELDTESGKVSVTEEQMQSFSHSLMEMFKDTGKLEFSVIQDHLLDHNEQIPRLMIWAGQRDAFFCTSATNLQLPGERIYYPAMTEWMAGLMRDYLEYLVSLRVTRRGGADDMRDLFQSLSFFQSFLSDSKKIPFLEWNLFSVFILYVLVL